MIFDIQNIPDEIVLKVFSYLDERELSKIELVSKQFFRIANDPYLWIRFANERKITWKIYEANYIKKLVENHAKIQLMTLRPIIKTLNIIENVNVVIYLNIMNTFEEEHCLKFSLDKFKKTSPSICQEVLSRALLDENNVKDLQKINILIENGALPNKFTFDLENKDKIDPSIFKIFLNTVISYELNLLKDELTENDLTNLEIFLKQLNVLNVVDISYYNMIQYKSLIPMLQKICLKYGWTIIEEIP